MVGAEGKNEEGKMRKQGQRQSGEVTKLGQVGQVGQVGGSVGRGRF